MSNVRLTHRSRKKCPPRCQGKQCVEVLVMVFSKVNFLGYSDVWENRELDSFEHSP